MRPVRGTDSHSAPTVPMEAVRLPIVEPDPAPKAAAPKPAKASVQAPRSPAPPEARPKQPPPEASRPAVSKAPPVQSPPKSDHSLPPVPDEPKPQAEKSKESKQPPQRGGNSTSVMLRSSRLHQLLEQTSRVAPSKTEAALLYDGLTPAKGVSVTDPGQIVIAPMQSFPGQRSVTSTQNVINQYAVVANPRYSLKHVDPREAGALFVFDVMSSQNTTLGQAFTARSSRTARPGTLVETWKWLNEAALSLGWRVVDGNSLWDALGKGLPVIAMAETPYGRRIAVVEPGFQGTSSKPRLASAHEPRGQGLTPEDVFGPSVVRYLAHD